MSQAQIHQFLRPKWLLRDAILYVAFLGFSLALGRFTKQNIPKHSACTWYFHFHYED
ncbi:hypothetical protein SODALDRAFT_364507 [Sodiomyces alkalinus F11]|uniref:Uncharacterized protein n=1 Tax=Sodiomyces alkalinus (strain CBS 110278 / VKM F-3762 / F11) TaxID=1314773 RepID=A0A3N2PJF8_SODAK|nr:hypothetical protein SODALDRAFT_364507 [Sodiomyces alkalinus F11]ROT34446.1 hypothetical protein SODALDRAFT_364507 [Sodiomyces alkalinus F11]